jgi:hypothetical protein
MSYHKEDIPNILKHYDPMNIRTWPFYVIEIPLNIEGQGPATVGFDAVDMTYEVWDHFCNSYGSHPYLPDAINQALKLTKELLADEPKE